MDAKQLWQVALEQVRAHVTPASYTTWFKPTVGREVCGDTLSVAVPNSFAREHLRQRFGELACAAVRAAAGRPLAVEFVVRGPVHESAGDHGMGQNIAPASAAPTPRLTLPLAAPRGRPPIRRERRAALDLPRATPRATRRGYALSATAQPPLLPLEAAPAHLVAAPTMLQAASQTTSAATGAIAATRGTGWGAQTARPADATMPAAATPVAGHDPASHQRFETFVVGTANRLAYAAARQVAAAPGASYNPLLIYGGTGLGKTHLLRAIAREAHARGCSVCYVAAERFANEMIESIRHQQTEAFRARYRAVDVLLVDDIHFIAGKESTEEEFFHTFNALHNAGRQLVLSSDRPPRAMRHLHDRLRSRFEWGLLADLQPPDAAHRLEIVRAKARALSLPLAEDALAALAALDHASVRELEGALTRVAAYARMMGNTLGSMPEYHASGAAGVAPLIGPDVVARAVAPLRLEADHTVGSAQIVDLVTRHFSIAPEGLRGKGRDHTTAWARQVAMYLLREETSASLGQIGQDLGGRDHTTIMHGCARVAQAMTASEATRREVEALRAALHQPLAP